MDSLAMPFEKEFVEVGDEEAEGAPYSPDDLDGCEPGFVSACDPGKQGEHQGHQLEIIMMNAMRLTLSNNVDGSGSGKCGWYRSSAGSVGAGAGSMFGCKGHSSSSGLGSARIGHLSLGPVTMDSNLGWGQSSRSTPSGSSSCGGLALGGVRSFV
jgi:hypothetical protein